MLAVRHHTSSVVRIAVHEASNGLEVAVHVAKHLYFSFFFNHSSQLLGRKYDWAQLRRRVRPHSVEVETSQICSRITVYYSVYVQHWYYVYDIPGSQVFGLL